MSMQTSPGWYPDPLRRFELRYWDGAWTEHVSTRGARAVDPPVTAPPVLARAAPTFPPCWHPDPFGRFDHRYWDGGRWTERVSFRGREMQDPPVPNRPQVAHAPVVDLRVQQQLHRAGVPRSIPGPESPLLTASVLVVNQKAKLFERRAEYAVFDENGHRVGAVHEVDRSLRRKATGGSSNGTYRFNVVDAEGRVVLALRRPKKVLKSTMTVTGANGVTGQIVQRNVGVFKGVRFALVSAGEDLGLIVPDDRREWDFAVNDNLGHEIARITKTWAGWA
ncbi:scramblase [Phycicoccus sp. DTK01]|nr:scramblase [Phycicoccus sp. DTK01]